MTSDQWSYLHKNIIFLVITLILKHVLFRLMQKYLSPIINCLLCSISWYSFGGHSQFVSYLYMFASYSYSCKILQPYVTATVQMHSDAVLSSTGALLIKTVIKNNRQKQMVHFRFGRTRLPDTCESAFTGIRFHGFTSCLHGNDENDHEKATYLNTQSKWIDLKTQRNENGTI